MLPSVRPCSRCPIALSRRLYSTASPVITENDVVLVRQDGTKSARWHLTAPLQHGKQIRLSYGGTLRASDLIGRRYHDQIKDDKGRQINLIKPSLASYIVNSKRVATPIYPHDAATIASLLDLNPSRPGEDDLQAEEEDGVRTMRSSRLEIFEAGTGMGSLTLHLARAIHGANPPAPPALRKALMGSYFQELPSRNTRSFSGVNTLGSGVNTSAVNATHYGRLTAQDLLALKAYNAKRRAVVHSLDVRADHIFSAWKLVRDYNHAQYLPNVTFHHSSIEKFFSHPSRKNAPFLAHAVLDLPGAEDHADHVINALLPSGTLVLFTPSISQIADFQKWSLQTRQPLTMVKVLELPTSVQVENSPDSSGGRPWEVKTRGLSKDGGGDGEVVQVMRPKVGDRVAGGGFVALMRKVDKKTGEETTAAPGEMGRDGQTSG